MRQVRRAGSRSAIANFSRSPVVEEAPPEGLAICGWPLMSVSVDPI
jgi:hypothetical protein